jgi:hypothetical protein
MNRPFWVLGSRSGRKRSLLSDSLAFDAPPAVTPSHTFKLHLTKLGLLSTPEPVMRDAADVPELQLKLFTVRPA